MSRLDTIRLVLMVAAQKGWKVFQLDVKSAFLNGVSHKEWIQISFLQSRCSKDDHLSCCTKPLVLALSHKGPFLVDRLYLLHLASQILLAAPHISLLVKLHLKKLI